MHLRFRQDNGLQAGPSFTPEFDGISRRIVSQLRED
jgi:hypothetical protein